MIGTLGIVAAGLLLPGLMLTVIGALILLVGATVASAYEADDTATSPRSRTRTTAGAIAGATAVGVAFGLSTVLSPAVLGLAGILTLTSPPAIRWYSGRLGASPSAGSHEHADYATAELCREWQDSYAALREATTPNARLRIVMARQRCLDELERRDPDGLHAWLSSSASAAGDPRRFLDSP